MIWKGLSSFLLIGSILTTPTWSQALKEASPPKPQFDLDTEKLLYVVGYAHLDTQWLWTYPTTIDQYLRDTLDQNFSNFEQFPDYTFNFTGSLRYQMLKEYYPEGYEKVKDLIAQKRWFVSGSSVDEGDVNVPSPESLIRQILYGNDFFRKEFGKESYDFMLPDCFGFPASMPSIWAHAGLKGFSTQKLTWGSAVGIPFNVGVWEGPDGESVVAALNPGKYVGRVTAPLNTNQSWINRVNHNGEKFGVFADYHYYGVGDRGGAPRPSDVKNVMSSLGDNGPIKVVTAPSDQMYLDITPEQKSRLPKYKGDLLLTEHSAGTLTSKAYMKRWNRKAELLADAAERASSIAHWQGHEYPLTKINEGWIRVLAAQMHDILPGTSIPEAYEFSYNDEVVALNSFAQATKGSVSNVISSLDTTGEGIPVVVYNPLAIERQDTVEALVPITSQGSIKVTNKEGQEVPSQILSRDSEGTRVLFLAQMPSMAFATYHVTTTPETTKLSNPLKVSPTKLENNRYVVSIASSGNVASIFDKSMQKELLEAPIRMEFLYEKPSSYPAWNMDWKDRQKPPYAYVDSTPEIKVVENGPVRVAIEVKREAQNSVFIEKISLTQGGDIVTYENEVDWQTKNSSLKVAFPLTASNPKATYNMKLGTIKRGNNEPKKYEVPSHEWLDLTDASEEFGVSILEDSKFGSDKPADNILRLTLLFSPNTSLGGHPWQGTQDWGHHQYRYGIMGHKGSTKDGLTPFKGARFNQPLMAFVTKKQPGESSAISFLKKSNNNAMVMAFKKAENSDHLILRIQEMWGEGGEFAVEFAAPIAEVSETDGQERRIASAKAFGDSLVMNLTPYEIKTFAIKLAPPPQLAKPITTVTVPLPFNTDVVSLDGNTTDGAFDLEGRTYPGEQLPNEITSENIPFQLGDTAPGSANALEALGQEIPLPEGDYNSLYILAAAEEDTKGTFKNGDQPQTITVQEWTGFVGNFDHRLWGFGYNLPTRILPGYIKRDNIAWFASHRHLADGKNDSYRFTYLFKYKLDIPKGTRSLTLPHNPKIKIFAATLAQDSRLAEPAAPLYDDFSKRVEIIVKDRETYGTPITTASIEKAKSYSQLKMTAPQTSDFLAPHHKNGSKVSYVGQAPHEASGSVGSSLPRLTDGKTSTNPDDIERSVWFENTEGLIHINLGKKVDIHSINTYSHHFDSRAPQNFIIYASAEEAPPLDTTNKEHWTNVAWVDTTGLGEGGVHGSSVEIPSELGPVRHIMIRTANSGMGTFFNEIDINTKGQL